MGIETKDEDASLEDDIRSALESQAIEDDVPAAKDQPRDETGKFTKEAPTPTEAAAKLEPGAEQKAPEQPAAVDAQQPAADPLLTPDKAPQGWGPAAREKWGTIPEDIRKEIIRREEDTLRGVRQLQEKYAPMEQFVRSMTPIFNESRAVGATPDQYLGALVYSERLLRTADVPAKFQEILRIADQYGVPLREVINQSVGQQVLAAAPQQQAQQLPPQVAQELQEMRQWRAQFEENNVNAEVTSFSQGKEFFNDVRLQMATLIEGGAATSLQEAYETACWANPQIREVMLARQNGQQQAAALTGKQAAAAGASVKPKGELDVKGHDENDDLEDTIRKAYADAATGRV